MVDSLAKYGFSFQIKIITCLLKDRLFLQQVSDILMPSYLESESNQWIVETIQSHFKQYSQPPTLEVLKVKVQDIKNDVLKAAVIDNLKEAFKYLDANDLDFIKDEVVKFGQNQCMKMAIMDSVALIESGQYDLVKVKVDNALKAGVDKDIGHEYKNHIEERYVENFRNVMETPWPVINQIVAGGFGSGELIIFVAPPGIGKSWGLVNIGAHLIKKGKTVVHYTLELSDKYVGLRYDAVLTGIANQNLKFHLDDVKSAVTGTKGNLIIKYYPTKTVSVMGLKAHIDKLKLQGVNPDAIIVDYADLLRGVGNNKEMRHQLDSIYEDLRGMAGEYECPVFTASQANRSSTEEDVIEGNKISESFSKIMIADFVISLSRKVTDKIAGTGRWHVIKNRFGPDGMTFPSRLNMSNGQINIHEESSPAGKEATNKMGQSGETMRKTLAQKFHEIKGDSLG